jgi:hypothetical protein
VICVDQGLVEDAYLSNHEGWERANMAPGDVIMVGGFLQDCLAMVADGDELVIISHGYGMGAGFWWGGMVFTGFGPGPGQGGHPHPVPPGFDMLDHVQVRLCNCWSARDPDGGGPDRSLTMKVLDAMFTGPNNGNSSAGFQGTADAGMNIGIDAPNQEAYDAADMCLTDNPGWVNNPPANRPGAMPNQQTAAQMIVDNCRGAAGVVVTIVYKQPVDGGNSPEGGFVAGCVCPFDPPGCGLATITYVPIIAGPAIPVAGNWALAAGAIATLALGAGVLCRRGAL